MKRITKIQYFDNSIQSHKLRVDKFFNTNVTHISNGVNMFYKDKDQQITFHDDQYVYKSYIFNKTLQSTVEKKENEIKRAEEFFLHYTGSLKLINTNRQHKNKICIMQFNKLDGLPIWNYSSTYRPDVGRGGFYLFPEIHSHNITKSQFINWMIDHAIKIHEAGIMCADNNVRFQTINKTLYKFNVGANLEHIFYFPDWNDNNILYDHKLNKLHLVDLMPTNWLSIDLWNHIARRHFNETFSKLFDKCTIKEEDEFAETVMNNIVPYQGK